MNTEEMKDWIDNASYEELLRKWRFAPIGSPYFLGQMGKYYKDALKKKRAEIGAAHAAVISKKIGWER